MTQYLIEEASFAAFDALERRIRASMDTGESMEPDPHAEARAAARAWAEGSGD